jgi:broad specificity phosphatase PhoE
VEAAPGAARRSACRIRATLSAFLSRPLAAPLAGGESYFDIISRLDPLVHELESYREPTLIVSHQAVLRMLYAYFKGDDRMEAPSKDIPLHTVIKLTYNGWSQCEEQRFYLGPDVPKNEQAA